MRVDADDFARPCSCGREHHIDVKEIVIESGAIGKLEEEMSDGDLREYISPLLICDTNSYKATEELMEDIYDRCQVLILDAEDLEADERAVEIVENYMEEDIDLVLAVGAGTIHDLSRFVAHQYRIPFVSVPTAASSDDLLLTCRLDMTVERDGEKAEQQHSAPLLFLRIRIFCKSTEETYRCRCVGYSGKIYCSGRLENSQHSFERILLCRGGKSGNKSCQDCEG